MQYKDFNDYELCYLVKENDDEALSIIFKKYENLIKKICTNFYKNYKYTGLDFDDLVQEARIGIMKALRGYDEEESLFYSYVCLCVERQLMTYCRNYNNLKNYPLNYSVGDDFLQKISFYSTSDLEILLLENERFFECKNSLKFNQSIVFELRYNNFSYKEIAKLLDISVTTVDGRIQMIRRKLKDNLK